MQNRIHHESSSCRAGKPISKPNWQRMMTVQSLDSHELESQKKNECLCSQACGHKRKMEHTGTIITGVSTEATNYQLFQWKERINRCWVADKQYWSCISTTLINLCFCMQLQVLERSPQTSYSRLNKSNQSHLPRTKYHQQASDFDISLKRRA